MLQGLIIDAESLVWQLGSPEADVVEGLIIDAESLKRRRFPKEAGPLRRAWRGDEEKAGTPSKRRKG